MPLSHVVQQGEYLASIAKHYGLASSSIWNHPENASLKQQRKNPNILFPGDTLIIPEAAEEVFSTGEFHRFRLANTTLKLRLKLRDVDRQPLKQTPCELSVEGMASHLTSDDNGLIEQDISATDKEATLKIEGTETTVTLKIGHLDPVDERSGQVARFHNLGYGAGYLSGNDEAQFQLALEEFQCNNNLKVDGICGDKTQAKLLEVHGC